MLYRQWSKSLSISDHKFSWHISRTQIFSKFWKYHTIGNERTWRFD